MTEAVTIIYTVLSSPQALMKDFTPIMCTEQKPKVSKLGENIQLKIGFSFPIQVQNTIGLNKQHADFANLIPFVKQYSY